MVSGQNFIDDTLKPNTNEVVLTSGTWYVKGFLVDGYSSSTANTRLQYKNGDDWINILSTGDYGTFSCVGNNTNPFGWMYSNQTLTITVYSPTYFRFNTADMDGKRHLLISNENLQSFVPYTECNIINITFPDEVGTVYGGTLTINEDGSGTLIATNAIVDLGSDDWTYYTSGTNPIFYRTVSGAKLYALNTMPNAISSMYKARQVQARSTFANNAANGEFSFFTNTESLAIRNDLYTSAPDFKTAMSGQTVLYELATPVTVSLTAEQINTLQGTNVVWVDDSDYITVTYQSTESADRSRNLEYNYLNLKLFNDTFIEKH